MIHVQESGAVDPLAQVVALLAPKAPFSKFVAAAGRWRVRRTDYDEPWYCVVLEGTCRLAVDGQPPITLEAGDFALVPAADNFTNSSLEPPVREEAPVRVGEALFRLGDRDREPDVRLIVGHCVFGSPDADLLVSLLPKLVHVRGDERLSTLVRLVADESRETRPARDAVIARLLEVLLIEALRSGNETSASAGLARGLADERLAAAIRCMHEDPARAWTVSDLAKEAALSRSAFFDRFKNAVGIAPMEYLLSWRMALAKQLLRTNELVVGEVAERVGYRSASTFSVAFSRHVGVAPTRYARTGDVTSRAARAFAGHEAHR